jgi:predicted ATP-binding protein involved in virulence
MNKDELVSYIQGLLDLSKVSEFDSSIETELLRLISEALEKHKNYINNEDVSYFNKKADAYSTPLSTEASVSFKDGVDKGWVKHDQITKRK